MGKKKHFIWISFFLVVAISTATTYFILKPFLIFLPHLEYLLGKSHPTSYLVLLQNDTELRANGGFAGSYAKVIASYPKFDLTFQDIYVPNGQLKGHVTPPDPIQKAFQHGTWELANADWEPDFPTAATSIRWFFEKGNEINPDLLVTLPLSTIKEILHIIGPFKVDEYQAELTADNFYGFLQSQTETNFFPGSTQKKDVLTATGNTLKKKLFHLSPIQYFKIAKIVLQDLNHKNISLNSTNQDFQNFLNTNHFDGKVDPQDTIDAFMMVEANLGSNKANCCVVRKTQHTITHQELTINHHLTAFFENRSTESSPYPPFSFSGHYVSYIRTYIPDTAWNISLLQHESTASGAISLATEKPTINKKFGFTEIGFFHTTAAGTTSSFDLSYNLATASSTAPYSLSIRKQHGLVASPQTINLFGHDFSTILNQDAVFGSSLP